MARLVRHAIDEGKSLKELSMAEYHSFSPLFGEDVYSITVEASLQSRSPRLEKELEKARGLVEGEGD